jgi:methionyl-tRNA formyltransferase
LKAVVLAYHEVGSVCLEELLASAIEVKALFTHEDDPEEEIWFRTPRALAEDRGIPVFTPDNLREPELIERIAAYEPDYLFSFYYRLMLPKEVLEIPRIAPLNLHGSLLPKFRGRCPVNWVLIEGEEKTGVTLHVMEVKPDAGDIVAQKEVGVAFEDTAHTLALKLATAARMLLRETLPLLESGTFVRRPQTGESSYYGGRRPEDGLIDWNRSAAAIYNLVRAVTHPYPGAFTFLDGKKLFVWKALPEDNRAVTTDSGGPGSVVSIDPLLVQTGNGRLRLTQLQLDGHGEMTGHAFLSLENLEKKRLGGRS